MKHGYGWTALALAGLACVAGAVRAGVPQAINYQGRLLDGTNLASGAVRMELAIYTNATGGTPLYVDSNTVSVVDGLYSTFIGDDTVMGALPDALAGGECWIEVRIDGTALSPREPLVSSAFALLADGVAPGAITTAMLAPSAITGDKIDANTITMWNLGVGSVMLNHIGDGQVGGAKIAGNAVSSDKIADGSIIAADLNAASFSNTFWKLNGNAGTTAGTHFLGTTDNRPLEVRANGLRALLITPISGSPDVVLGAAANAISNGTYGGAVLGGSNNTMGFEAHFSSMGGGADNRISDYSQHATIGGGWANQIVWDSDETVIGGGRENRVYGDTAWSVIAGGYNNIVNAISQGSVISGGTGHRIGEETQNATIGGGAGNLVSNDCDYAVIAGGANNVIASNALYGTIGGGEGNQIGKGARYATVPGGNRARANHPGVFLWADASSASTFASAASNEVAFRCKGGVRFTSDTGAGTHTVAWTPGGGSWTFTSDERMKDLYGPADGTDVLARLAALPLYDWSYKGYAQRHIGPTAQDFHRAFPLNSDDATINSLDVDGVSLAAIQELHRLARDQQATIDRQQQRIERLEKALEGLLKTKAP